MQIAKGTRIKGRYEILEQVGEGGFGVIYRARDLELDRDVALKIPKDLQATEDEKIRFMREAKLLAQLLHPNIVRVYSIEILHDEKMLIVMEFLRGKSLKNLLSDTQGSLSQEQCQQVIPQICRGLAFAHDSGLMHRDLSPANIFISVEPSDLTVKLIDFGLSRLFEKASGHTVTLTRTGVLIGNPAYMSPEACRGEKSDKQSDIYTLGCVLYEMISGRQPFVSSSPIGFLHLHQNKYPSEPVCSWQDKEFEGKIKKVTLKCLQKDKSKRFQSVDEILAELEASSGSQINDPTESLVQWAKELDAHRGRSSLSFQPLRKRIMLLVIAAISLVFLAALIAKRYCEYHRASRPVDLIVSKQDKLSHEIAKLKEQLARQTVSADSSNFIRQRYKKLLLLLGRTQLRSPLKKDILEAAQTYSKAVNLARQSRETEDLAIGYALRARALCRAGEYSA